MNSPLRIDIHGMGVDLMSMPLLLKLVERWSAKRVGRSVCVSNVHMCMESYDSEEYRNVVNSADLVVPDGRPLVWMQKLLGYQESSQVRGFDILNEVCRFSAEKDLKVGFYGSTDSVLDSLKTNLVRLYPNIQIVQLISPSYNVLDVDESASDVKEINESGLDVLFVGLGCPKQEIWMYQNRPRVQCTMFGVGAAFDFIAGNKKHAPKVLQRVGLEWFFRFLCEPRRLWKRYFKHNPRFLLLSAKKLLKGK